MGLEKFRWSCYFPGLRSLLTACLLFSSLRAAPADSITGQPLLGTSFGIAGINATYDFVIVGGGNAGLVLANRLSECGEHTVAVVEAGSFYELSNGNQSQIPRWVWNGAGLGFDDVNPLVDWMFKTQSEDGLGGQRIHYARGRTLGGSSARNHMMYQRGTRGAYKRWADQVGDASYEWDSFKKWFDKSATFYKADMTKRLANSTPELDPAGERATSGPVSISYTNYVLPFTTWLLKAVNAMGLNPIPGFIDGELIGSSWHLRSVSADTQVRDSSETAYLRPAMQRSNLIVYTSTMATKVLFNGTGAGGIQCNALGKSFTLLANKEVILSAGAFQSPQLLMVSGIGPKETLARFDIPVLIDAPGVGQGMEDHASVGITHKLRLPSSTVLNTSAKNVAAVRDYLANGTGPLAGTGAEVFAWEKLPRRLLPNNTAAALDTTPDDWPDMEYIMQSSYPGTTPPDADDYGGMTVGPVNTFSRGKVTISSSSMLDPPIIYIGLLSDQRDQEALIAGVRRGREILAHPSLEPVIRGPEVVPGSATTDEQILKFIQSSGRTFYHASCTCKMGKKNDTMAVVDVQGRVFGAQKLRVIDISAMPLLPPGHPMSTVYALAEKIAEDILAQ